jgi:ankyrin repeat protein
LSDEEVLNFMDIDNPNKVRIVSQPNPDIQEQEEVTEEQKSVLANARTLMNAVRSEKLEMVKLVVEEMGVDVNSTDTRGWSPMHAAVFVKDTAIAEYLLDMGAKIDIKAKGDGFTPLHNAVNVGNYIMAKLIIDKLGDKLPNYINMQSKEGRTPLFSACSKKGELNTVQLLLKNGADPCIADYDKITPLHAAASSGRVDIVEELLNNKNKKVELNAKDKNDVTPLLVAVNHVAAKLQKYRPREPKTLSNRA